MTRHPPITDALVVWGVAATVYFVGFFHRVAPAVMADRLMADFAIGAAALGQVSAFYFYSYVAMQIPTGFLADTWGPRRLLTAGSAIAAVGALIFALAPTATVAGLGRLLIGGSVAVAWVAMLKLATHWLPPRYFATITGLALFCGVAGALSAGVPLRLLVEDVGWRQAIGALAAVGLAQAVAVWLFVRDDPTERGYAGFVPARGGGGAVARGHVWISLATVFRYRNTWLLTLAPGALVGSVTAFCGLWGVPFLVSHYGLSPARAAAVTSAGLMAWALGGPVLGAVSDRIGRRRPLYAAAAAVAAAGWAVVAWVPDMAVPLLTAVIAVAGFACGSIVIGFAYGKESVPPSRAGTVSGVINMGVMAGPMLLQPAIGAVLEFMWDGHRVDAVPAYGFVAYRAGFSLMAAWCAVAAVLIVASRETHGRQAVADPA